MSPGRSRSEDPLEQAGWQRRFMVAQDRVAEYVELYRRLGYEVRTRKVTVAEMQDRPECRDCLRALCHNYVVLYTRRGNATTGSSV